ncbi:MAG: hypothetical protein AAFZ92_02660, partial [Pseudomonadota bacterium]
FASKKYNPDLISEDEFEKARIREQENIEKERRRLGITPGPATYGSEYSTPSPIRYNTQEPTDYEAYKQWRAARGAENSPEYERFKLWQEFEQFQRWKEAQEAAQAADN